MAAVASTRTNPKPETRETILDACDRIMSRYGFRKMTMDDLAKEARLSKRTLYLYFSGKEDVGLSSIGRVVESVHAELERLADSSAHPADRLRQMLERRVMGRVEQVQAYHQSLDELFEVVRPAYMTRRQHYFNVERDLIASVLGEGTLSGQFSVADPPSTAEALLLATNAFLPYSLSVRELGNPDGIRTRLAPMLDLLLRGVQSPTHKEAQP
jgi:AcrR family transcriptional regulator